MVRYLINGFWALVAAIAIAAGLLLAFPSTWGSHWLGAWLSLGLWLLILRRARRSYALVISILTSLLFDLFYSLDCAGAV